MRFGFLDGGEDNGGDGIDFVEYLKCLPCRTRFSLQGHLLTKRTGMTCANAFKWIFRRGR